MIRPLTIGGAVLGALALTSAITAQQSPTPQGPGLRLGGQIDTRLATPAGPAPKWLLDSVDLHGGDMFTFVAPTARENFQLSMRIGGNDYLLAMRPNDLRSDNYQLLVDDGNTITPAPRSESTTWRGIVLTEDGPIADAVVAVSIANGAMDGMIDLGAGRGAWFVEPTSKYDASMPATSHILYHQSDVATEGGCSVGENGEVPVNSNTALVGGSGLGTTTLREAEIAFDADFDLYQRRGSNVTSTENFILSILNGADAIYVRDVDITYVATTILVRTSVTYTSTSAGGVLTDFRNRWNAFHGSIQRDLAHLFSGKTTFGSTLGIAALSTVCNTGAAYGVNDATISTGALTAVFTHEMGHNWSAQHCNGTSNCMIMCASLGGCGPTSAFGPSATGQIVSFRNSRTCLTIPPPPGNPPVITGISPSNVKALPDGPVTLTGTDFTGTTSIFVGIQSVTPLVLSDTTMTFVPPAPTALGPAFLIAENQAGTSGLNFLTYIETNPPAHTAPAIVFQPGSISWQMGGAVGDSFFLVANFNDATTIPVFGINLLNNPLVFSSGVLDTVGLAGFVFPLVPTPSLTGLQIRSQVITLDTSNGNIAGSNPILTTVF